MPSHGGGEQGPSGSAEPQTEGQRPEGTGRPSQIPSCEGCKIRKTRCDRVQPVCGACAVRGVQCKPGVPRERQAQSSKAAQLPADPPGGLGSTPASMPEALLRAFRGLHLKGRINRAATLQTLRAWQAHSKDMTEFGWAVYQAIFLAVNVLPGELENAGKLVGGSLLERPVADEAKEVDIRFFPTFRALDDGDTPMLVFYYVGLELRVAGNKAFDETFAQGAKSAITHTTFALCTFLAGLVAPEDAEDLVASIATFLFEGCTSLSQVLKFHDRHGVDVVACFRLRLAALPELDARMGVVTIQPLPPSRYVMHPLLAVRTNSQSVKRAKRAVSEQQAAIADLCDLPASRVKPEAAAAGMPGTRSGTPTLDLSALPLPMQLPTTPIELWNMPFGGPGGPFPSMSPGLFVPSDNLGGNGGGGGNGVIASSGGCFTPWAPGQVWGSADSSMQQGQGQGQVAVPPPPPAATSMQVDVSSSTQPDGHTRPPLPPLMIQQSPRLNPAAAASPCLTDMLSDSQGVCRWGVTPPAQREEGGGEGEMALPLPPCWVRDPQAPPSGSGVADSLCSASSAMLASGGTPEGPKEDKALWLFASSIFTD